LGLYRAVLEARDTQLDAIEADLAVFYDRAPPADTRAPPRLSCPRDVATPGHIPH
jgi:hypothetical protein